LLAVRPGSAPKKSSRHGSLNPVRHDRRRASFGPDIVALQNISKYSLRLPANFGEGSR
jgi:hypothetical protein